MKLKLDRIISIATLAAMVAIFLVLRKPTPVVVQVPATTAAPAQSSGQPMEQREQAAQQGFSGLGRKLCGSSGAGSDAISESAGRRSQSSAESRVSLRL